MCVQAVLLAGDRGASRAVKGQSKAFVEVGGKPMVVHVLEALVHTPEVSEIFVVGDAVRLEKVFSEFGCTALAATRSRPLHVVPQRDTLYQNVWHAFLRSLPPGGDAAGHPIFVVPSDIPLVVPEELSEFISQAFALDTDYVIGLTPDFALLPYASRDGDPGIEMACFNTAEGRYRQSNLHLVRPLRMGNRQYIQDMYENRYQKELGSMLRLGWRILTREYRSLWVLLFYLLLHVAGVLDRRGHRAASDRVRAWVSLRTVERAIGALLATRVATATTALGGAALDLDNEGDLQAADKRIDRWKAMQVAMAAAARRADA